MKSFKVVGEPMSIQTQIRKEISCQRKLARQNDLKIDRIEVLNAYEFFAKNPWAAKKFKGSKRPKVHQKIIIVYYALTQQSPAQQTKSQINMQRPQPTKRKTVSAQTAFIKKTQTIPFKQPVYPTLQDHISPLALQQRISLALVRTRTNTHLLPASRCISFRPLSQRVA